MSKDIYGKSWPLTKWGRSLNNQEKANKLFSILDKAHEAYEADLLSDDVMKALVEVIYLEAVNLGVEKGLVKMIWNPEPKGE